MVLDDNIKDILTDIISCFLPHNNLDETLSQDILNETENILPLDDMSMEYYVMFRTLSGVVKINNSGRITQLSRDAFIPIIENIILNESISERIKLKEYLTMNGEMSDLASLENRNKANTILYTLCLQLYDEAYNRERHSSDYANYITALRESVLSSYAYDLINSQGAVLRDGAQIGKNQMQGPSDWLKYTKTAIIKLDSRFSDSNKNKPVIFKDSSIGRGMLEKAQNRNAVLASTGLPPFDEGTPLQRHRLWAIVAAPNVGKTTYMLYLVIQLILNGKKVAILSGEEVPEQLYVQLLSAYIRHQYGLYISASMIKNIDDCSPEEARLITLYSEELSSLGLLTIQKQFSYSTFYTEAVALRNQFEYDALFIDHTLSMGGLTEVYSNLGALAFQLRELKNNFPIHVIALSHLSVITAGELRDGKPLSDSPCTKGNGDLESEADEVLVLTASPDLKKRGQISFINKKRRDAPVLIEPMIARMDFQYKVLSYHEEDQIGNIKSAIDTEEAINRLKTQYGISDFEDDDD